MRLAKLTAVTAVFMALAGFSLQAHAEDADAAAAQKVKQERADCLGCHSAQGLKNPPRQDMDLKTLGGMLIDADKLAKSVHADTACSECHGQSVTTYPHGASAHADLPECADCHKRQVRDIAPEFKDSVHVKAKLPNFTCATCHDPHVWQKASKLGSPRAIVKQDNAICQGCHDSDEKFAKFTTDKRRDLADIHGWLPSAELHWKAVRCVDCHTATKENGGVSHAILSKDKAERRCVECHSANSSLSTRLYRQRVEEAHINSVGFINSYILNEAYVLGVTRNQWLDWASFAGLALVIAGLGGHGFLRFLSNRLRKGGK